MNKSERDAVDRWMAGHHRCFVCWWPKNDKRRIVELHHFCGGFSRSKGHDPRNYMLLCERCHGIFHSGKVYGLCPDLTAAMLLTAKAEADGGNYDPEFLAYLKNKKHLGYDPKPLPEYYITERRLNSQAWTQRQPWPK